MRKKNGGKKSLKKKFSAALEIFMDQKSKKNTQLLKDFIEEKVNEIDAYSGSLGKKEKKKEKKKEGLTAENIEVMPTPNLQPSSSLVDELQNRNKSADQSLQEN